jgi:hypothetical protein
MKNLIGILMALVVLGGLIFLARPDPTKESNTPSSTIAQGNPVLNGNSLGALVAVGSATHDFGSISMKKGVVNHTFNIKNMGMEAITINKMYTSCMCTTATLYKGEKVWGPFGMPGHGRIPKIEEKLVSGEEGEVRISFDPAAHGPAGVGTISRSIYLENNGAEKLELQFSALVTP